jgi:hypothetical protein
MRPIVLLLALAAAACGGRGAAGTAGGPPAPSGITSADQLIGAMHQRYAGKWYRNLVFVQKSTYMRPDGTPSRVETWYEALGIPGRLRIDIGDLDKGNGALYRNDSLYSIQEGRVAMKMGGRNPLLVLGFDVYAQPPARTLAQLRKDNVDVSVMHTSMLDGKRHYVVGAGPGDTTRNQFWVEADRLLFTRLVAMDTLRRRAVDTRFRKYVPHGGGWVAEEVRVLSGGRMIFHEEYSKVRVNVTLDDNLFLPERWRTATHWFKQ